MSVSRRIVGRDPNSELSYVQESDRRELRRLAFIGARRDLGRAVNYLRDAICGNL